MNLWHWPLTNFIGKYKKYVTHRASWAGWLQKQKTKFQCVLDNTNCLLLYFLCSHICKGKKVSVYVYVYVYVFEWEKTNLNGLYTLCICALSVFRYLQEEKSSVPCSSSPPVPTQDDYIQKLLVVSFCKKCRGVWMKYKMCIIGWRQNRSLSTYQKICW